MRGHNYSRANHDELAPAVELVRDRVPWWHNTEQLAEFAEWMADTGRESHWKRVVAKPWHYDDEYRTYGREQEMERLHDEDEAFTELERRRGL